MSHLHTTSGPIPDDALWLASCQGDRDAFGEIVRRYQSLVCSLAYSRTGDLAASQDLAQETFVTAWRRIADVREPARLRAWLCGIVRNLAANATRVHRRRGGPATALDDVGDPPSPSPDPEAQAVTQSEEALLWEAVGSLPDTYREPLILVGTRAQRDIHRVRVETGTDDEAYAAVLAARRLPPGGERRLASTRRLLGLPLFAYGSTGLDVGARPSRVVRGWVAVGDVAISPLLAVGGIAVAPIAIGGITTGALSLSVAGVALGLIAAGSLAAGWCAFGIVALGWRAAAGAPAIARDYAIGPLARAAEANTAAAIAWFEAQWFTVPMKLYLLSWPVLIAAAIVIPLVLLARSAWRLRRPSHPRRQR